MRPRTLPPLVLAAALLAGCSGSSGVEVSHDWSGVGGYVVADVDGLVTIVGIDTDRDQARSLVVIPDRADDDDAAGPVLARNAAGQTVLQRPTSSGSSTLYRVVSGDEAANRVGSIAERARLYPWSGGWVEVAPGPGGSVVRVLGPDLALRRTVKVPVRPDAVATDGAGGLCVAGNTESTSTVIAVDLRHGTVGTPVAFAAPVGALACPAGKPLIGVSAVTGAAGDGPPVARVLNGKVRSVAVTQGRLDGLVVTGDRAYVVAAVGQQVSVLVVDLASGVVVRTAVLDGLQVADDVFLSHGVLVVAGEESVAVFDPATGKVAHFGLPGQVYPG